MPDGLSASARAYRRHVDSGGKLPSGSRCLAYYGISFSAFLVLFSCLTPCFVLNAPKTKIGKLPVVVLLYRCGKEEGMFSAIIIFSFGGGLFNILYLVKS